MKKPFYLHLRGGVWYYRLNRESGLVDQDEHIWHSTGFTDRKDAENYVFDLMGVRRGNQSDAGEQSFREYAALFFIWDDCPHIRRILEETGRYTERHARIQRGRLENHLFTDPFTEKKLSNITRADIFDLRSRLLKKNAPATVNKVIGVVKIILREAVIREELDRDPTEYVRNVKGKKRERGIFTVDELKRLFPEYGYGPWNDSRVYTCFYLAAVSGARRGELLVLRWRHIHFERRFIHITEACKGREIIGETKSGRDRAVVESNDRKA